ncbi:uncharacterized protein LOC132746172 [Ruditapes philippinarum]|uniref:uncharacterized protein LOC132746172 n=1 Tax=Ruditapes philippinarum TaxID=129788 RepID=UPI00295A5ACC|nr:uncharacterized protein LOC132746172 [Ruditapes philippinarum]
MCKNGGDCIVKDGRPFCNCTDGYYGDRCEKSNCTLKCYNGGWCYRYGSNEFCWCPRRFIGDQCQQHYKNPDTCPLPKEDDGTCQCQCSRNSHCKEDEVCCKEGCSSFCRKKKQDFCEYEGKTYAINSTYSPSPCTNCTCDANAEMVCYSISCAIPRCLYGEPETLPGQCCPSCPDKPDPPTISNCPTSVLSVDVSIDSGSAILRKSITTINAYDSDGNKLKVKYQPRKVYHCQCWSPKPISVQAYTEDDLGGTASCSFNVTVKDPHPPRFYNCPKDIHVVENTSVRWNEPSYEDNVGIGRFIGPGLSGSIFPVGSHNMTYQVWDFDGNTASCVFSIYVVQRGPPKLYHCPADVIRLNTSLNTNFAVIKDTAIGLQAYDIDGNKLHVTYQPQTIDHCKCSDSHKANFEVSAMAVDDYGKVARCNFTVTVRDIFPPKVSFCPDDISVLEGDVVTWKDPVFVDNVGIAQNYVNMEKGTSYPVGRHTVVYSVKDYDRNEASCSFEIIVDKAKPDPPKIHNCPVNVVQLNTSYMSDYAIVDNRNTVTSGIFALDADGNYLQIKYSPEKVYHCKCSSYNTVTTTIFAEAVDSHGNKDTCQFKVVVKDIYKPVFTSCPSHIYVSENERVTWQEPTYYDNVGVLDMSRSGYESGQVPPAGNHTVYYKVWDFQYNTAICKFNITVTKEPPKPPKILNCPIKVLSLNTAFNSDEAKLSEDVTTIKAYDNEGSKLKVNYQPAAVRHCYCFNTHTTETTVIAWAVDDAGVKETCEFNVTVSDKQAPVITKCPGDIERYEGETIDDVRRQPVEFQDNVKVANDYWSIQTIDTFTPGKHNVSFEIWDYDYNNARCNFTVTVTRRKVPKIKNCPPNDLFLSAPSNGNSVMLSESTTSIEAYDGDGNKLMVNYKPASVRHCFCGISTSNYTRVEASATDSAGNAVSCSFRAFVLDEVKPVFTYCPGNMIVRENTVVSWREPVYHDNVAVVNKSISGWKRDTVFPVGRHKIVYEIWDFDGNSATCQFSVVVIQECTLECQNGGRCYRQGNDQLCICTPDYIGTYCENKCNSFLFLSLFTCSFIYSLRIFDMFGIHLLFSLLGAYLSYYKRPV